MNLVKRLLLNLMKCDIFVRQKISFGYEKITVMPIKSSTWNMEGVIRYSAQTDGAFEKVERLILLCNQVKVLYNYMLVFSIFEGGL